MYWRILLMYMHRLACGERTHSEAAVITEHLGDSSSSSLATPAAFEAALRAVSDVSTYVLQSF
jgi:hypothetical protein